MDINRINLLNEFLNKKPIQEVKEYGYTKDGVLMYKGNSSERDRLMKIDRKQEPKAKFKKVEGENLPKPGNKMNEGEEVVEEASSMTIKGSGNAVDSHKKALDQMIKQHGGKAKQKTSLHHVVSGGDKSFSVYTRDNGGKITSTVVFNEGVNLNELKWSQMEKFVDDMMGWNTQELQNFFETIFERASGNFGKTILNIAEKAYKDSKFLDKK